ncbi:MAG: amidohydrolase [Candidatus Nanopelagicales bacterium]
MTADAQAGVFVSAEQSAVIDSFLSSHADELLAFRRHMHAHPELSGVEDETTEAIVNRLQVAGLEPEILTTGTGVVCDVVGPRSASVSANAADPGAAPGDDVGGPVGTLGRVPVVALRADIDALAMSDQSTTPYRSTVPGVAHACGHDVHSTIVLGAGLLLAQLMAAPDAPTGRVRLIFEPSEEMVPGGAVDVIGSGYLDEVDAIFGLHCDPKIDVGHLGLRPGPITSAADLVEIVLSGPGGHTARPEQTVDLVEVAARIALEVPALLGGNGLNGELRLVFGSLRAGDAANVIPSTARLTGSMRTPSHTAWEEGPARLRAAIAQVVDPTGAQWELHHRRGVPPVVNDPVATELAMRAVTSALGPDALVATGQSWGGDSFGWYLERAPGSYLRLGTHNPASIGPRLDLHAGSFDVDEAAIPAGIRVLVTTALMWLRSHS